MSKTTPIDFTKLNDFDDLPKWLGVEAARLREFLDHADRYYTTVRLTKKRQKSAVRTVYKVERDLAAVQRLIARSIALARMAFFPEHVQGFVGTRSIVTNAEKHLGKKLVLCVDLQDFFESVRGDAVRGAFRFLGCGIDAAVALANLCMLNDRLPQGASASPILSNLAARAFDADMLLFSATYQCAYTRYADDLTFSGDTVPTPEQIDEVAKRHGFSLNPAKTRLQRRGRRQYVTGLTVCDPVSPRVPRRIKKNLRLVLRCAEKLGLNKHYAVSPADEPQRLLGLICYVNGIEPELGQRFFQQYNNAIAVDRHNSE